MYPKEVKYQVFLSSTYEDLIDERKGVVETILRSFNFPIGMEMFNANSKKQWEIIKATIDTSDVYILIIGHRYGTLTTGRRKISYTQKEFEYALIRRSKANLPILAFIRERDNVHIKPSQIEKNPESKIKLEQFIAKVQNSGLMVNTHWKTHDDLASLIASSLSETIQEINNDPHAKSGWVKREIFDKDESEKKSFIKFKESFPTIKAFIRKAAAQFDTINDDKEVYHFDEHGNCIVERERKQVCNCDVTHNVTQYISDKKGNYEVLEAIDLRTHNFGKKLTPIIIEDADTCYDFCIVFDEMIKKGDVAHYRIKVKVDNYVSKLIDNGTAYLGYSGYPLTKFSNKIDVLIFPHKTIFDNLTVKLIQIYPGTIENRYIAPQIHKKKKIYTIDYGTLSAGFELRVELKLN